MTLEDRWWGTREKGVSCMQRRAGLFFPQSQCAPAMGPAQGPKGEWHHPLAAWAGSQLASVRHTVALEAPQPRRGPTEVKT